MKNVGPALILREKISMSCDFASKSSSRMLIPHQCGRAIHGVRLGLLIAILGDREDTESLGNCVMHHSTMVHDHWSNHE